MERRNLFIGIAVILAAVLSAAAVGAGIAGSVQTTTMDPAVEWTPTPTPESTPTPDEGTDGAGEGTTTRTTTPGDGGAPETTTGTGDGDSNADVEMMVEVNQPSEGVGDNQSAKFDITIRRSDGSPVKNANVKLQSVGAAGEFVPGNEVTTDSEGKATCEWVYHQPTDAEDYPKMPPSEQTSMAIQATVNGNEVSQFVTVKLNIDPYIDGCHSEGEDL
ncbi:MAG TPA: hypothetical protein VJ898_06855 [Natrialbaceae archaeon]|nr:hypothetical protein [Natrialbaceae archaeon]